MPKNGGKKRPLGKRERARWKKTNQRATFFSNITVDQSGASHRMPGSNLRGRRRRGSKVKAKQMSHASSILKKMLSALGRAGIHKGSPLPILMKNRERHEQTWWKKWIRCQKLNEHLCSRYLLNVLKCRE